MSIGQTILGILLFALAAAVLYVWGMKKSITRNEDLSRQLMSVCGSRVMKYLKKNESITKKEIAKLIEGTTVGTVWSKQRITVTDGKKVADSLIEYLVSQQYIIDKDGKNYIRKD